LPSASRSAPPTLERRTKPKNHWRGTLKGFYCRAKLFPVNPGYRVHGDKKGKKKSDKLYFPADLKQFENPNWITEPSDSSHSEILYQCIDELNQLNKAIILLYLDGNSHDEISKINYDMLIIDEAHYLRNRNTQQWKFVNSLKKKYMLMLTATPIQGSLEELYNIITILKPGQLKTVSEFKKTFMQRGDHLKPKNIQK
jgi:superfamily II DNA or RNA helicase